MKNFLKRTLTGIIYAALIIGAVLGGGWWFVGIFGIFTVLAANEFGTICNASIGGENIVTRILDSVGALVLFTGLCCVNIGLLTPRATAVLGGTFFTLYLLYLIIRLVIQLYSREPSPLTNLAYSYMGQLYIALPLGIMSMYYTLPNGTSLLMAMFIMIWLSDTGAFLVGSMMGRHKLFPRISPGKTWEGTIGGIIFVILSGVVMKTCFGQYFESVSMLLLCSMGVVVAIFATWGDLVESLIKRTLGVKDSGTILPGHGGILDRIDSLLLVIPASLVFLINVVLYF
ncbi:phosphatidate cytidylyltransferase [uncultured Duncaniella sp.]|uniref:phosphatidate cytidylyltransferase n=1 Tax=uncultured Duncaniella sp. TaxID=2768039 RepID=UPI002676950C|nr:phosphatidate cytidylyltransferase [uncultured Duncaniella sp.]MCI9171636.1 CDP-archaeol synthase [Muribaculaceae bacterium]